jgi:acyl-coenzyme A thioesterase 13
MSLTDTLGSLVIATKGHYMTGVSTDISMFSDSVRSLTIANLNNLIGASFVRPAGRVGDVLLARTVLVGMGALQRQPKSKP